MKIKITDLQKIISIRGENWVKLTFPNGVVDENNEWFITNDKPQPTLFNQIKSVTKAAFDWSKAGFKQVEPSVLEERLKICGGCEFWDSTGFAGTGRCQKCGCSTQAKLRMATEKCPIDKWGVSP